MPIKCRRCGGQVMAGWASIREHESVVFTCLQCGREHTVGGELTATHQNVNVKMDPRHSASHNRQKRVRVGRTWQF